MSRLIKVSAIVFAFALLALPTAASAAPYAIDASHSVVLFKAQHFGAGYTYGRFRGVSGTIDLAGKKSSVSISIDAASIYTAQRKRDGHLKSPDFLNVKQFPKITFKSTKVSKRGKIFSVTGKLTLHGVTKTITVKMAKTGEGKNKMSGKQLVGFEGTFSIDRTAYGMKKLIGPVSKKITLTIAVEAMK
jgi:polyisoprenoid-binding protein YceI